MKKMLSVGLFILLSNLTYGQFSIKKMISISKMDNETFEIYAMDMGYSFHQFYNYSDTIHQYVVKANGISMLKYVNGDTRYIRCTNTERYVFGEYNRGKTYVNYQTDVVSELKQIYNELKLLGFNLYHSENDNSYNKYYSRSGHTSDGETVVIKIEKNWLEIEYYKQ